MQSPQVETNCIAPQHLVTNLEYKLKPCKKRTKFLTARIDTCANVNLMPISVYKLLYKDHDCQKLAPSNKSKVNTYCTEKIHIVGSCDLFVLHPDTKWLQEVAFQVTSHEGSVIISCATSLELGLIQPHRNLHVVPEKGSLIYSKADLPVKQKNKKSVTVNKLSDSVNSSQRQSHTVSRVQDTEVIQCMNKKVGRKSKQQQCQAPFPTVLNDNNCQAEKVLICSQGSPKKDMQSNRSAMLIQHKMLKKQEDDKNCQSGKNVKYKYDDVDSQFTLTQCSDKKCQEIMQPVKPQMDMQLKKPARLQSSYKKKDELKYAYEDKNCQDTTSEYNDSKCQSFKCLDKNCQENENINMWSVTNTDNMWVPKPAVPNEYRRLCSDKGCQSTRCYKKSNYDKNCQSANIM